MFLARLERAAQPKIAALDVGFGAAPRARAAKDELSTLNPHREWRFYVKGRTLPSMFILIRKIRSGVIISCLP
jgi:molybdopterin/thiamine biosynthesis adenylyltransferase